MAVLEVKDLTKEYGQGDSKVVASTMFLFVLKEENLWQLLGRRAPESPHS